MKIIPTNGKALVKTGRTIDEPSREPGAAQCGWDTREQWGEEEDKAEGRGRGPGSPEPMHRAKVGSPKHGGCWARSVTASGTFGDNHFSSLVRRRRWGWREMEGWCLGCGLSV